MKSFVAVSTEIINDKLVLINTSTGNFLFDENGIKFDKAIEFLFSLRQEKTVFVSYGFSKDSEFIFSTMPKELKDKLFQSHNIKTQINKIDFEQEKIDELFFNTAKNTQEFEQLDFEKYVNFISRQELLEVKSGDYRITLASGKRLTIHKGKKSISIYDIFGFFKPKNLTTSCKEWLDLDIQILDKTVCNSLSDDNLLNFLRFANTQETTAIKSLVEKLDSELSKQGINLARYHGATAVTSWILTKSKAKEYFHAYRYKRQMSNELDKAAYQSYYGGRGEQFKIGTLENVNIYDINSAYAFASSFLPIMLSKLYFTKDYQEQPFSLWFCEYDFTDIDNCYFGYLPNREIYGQTKYKLKGRGYFWLPEIQFVLQNFPECIKIEKGFALDYEVAPFTEYITESYNLRLELQKQSNPLEKVIKKALQSVYGKFCQHQGKGHFFNMFYAGFICSFVRRMLLDATRSFEKETICFLTDAIHTTATLPIPISNKLGEYKLESYDKVIYLDNGVYQCWKNGEIIKTKHKGSKEFDFTAALKTLQQKQYYQADNKIFVGHNIFSLHQFQNAEYLRNIQLHKAINPIENVSRIFENKQIDLSKDFIDSKPYNLYNGKESGLYRHNEMNINKNDFTLDLINARA